MAGFYRFKAINPIFPAVRVMLRCTSQNRQKPLKNLGCRHPVEVSDRGAFRQSAGNFPVDFGLFLAKGIAGPTVAGGGFNAADAAPARAAFSLEWAHHFFGVMDSAAVAEQCFGHCNPSANGSGSS
jgi:hypothetical protein